MADTPADKAKKALKDHAFKPGQSGNPGGKPKALKDVIALARQHTPMAIAALVEIIQTADRYPAARVAAINTLLDRGWGKPALTMADENGEKLEGPVIQVYLPSNGRD